MQILLDDKKVSNFSFIQEGMHSLGCQSLNEVFFDIFEIKNKDFELVKEKRGEFDGKPVVEIDLFLENRLYKNVKFVLSEHNKITINKNLLQGNKTIIESNPKKQKPLSKGKFHQKIISEKQEILKTETPEEIQRKQLMESIKDEILGQFKQEIKNGVIADLLKTNIKTNFDSFLREDASQAKLQKYFQNENNKFRKEIIEISEKIARRESMRFAESGGGSNAIQLENGGTINGNLTITGDLTVNGSGGSRDQIERKIFNIGDGTSRSFTFTHNLDTKDILMNVQDSTTNEVVIPYIKIVDNNSVIVEFSFVPDINSYRLIIFG